MPEEHQNETLEAPTKHWWQLSKQQTAIIGCAVGVVLIVVAGLLVWSKGHHRVASTTSVTQSHKTVGGVQQATSETAIQAGKQLSSGHCSGTGSGPKLSVSPMKPEDFSHIEPYGLMVGGHVTPVDHQYYSPTVFNSPKDTYEVRAMGDATIVELEVHPTRIRLVFSVSCTFFYYYDLLTSVEPGINDKALPIPVKAGQLIGHIGGQTLDFAVWDTTKPLKGFVVPEHYKSEAWKIYTADPLNYETADLKALSLSKYVRTAEPRSGKIDYDVDGKLIGTWFQKGTNGYGGVSEGQGSAYWTGHLSFVPDHYDPTTQIISIGYLAPADGAGQNQFAVPKDEPNPADITPQNGLVKYTLKKWSYLKTDGSRWNSLDFTTGVTVSSNGQATAGCALAQMTGARTLSFETFMGSDCSAVTGFKDPKTYER